MFLGIILKQLIMAKDKNAIYANKLFGLKGILELNKLSKHDQKQCNFTFSKHFVAAQIHKIISYQQTMKGMCSSVNNVTVRLYISIQ